MTDRTNYILERNLRHRQANVSTEASGPTHFEDAPITLATMEPEHIPGVLDLINEDRLPGQPICTEDMLQEALAGRSQIDSDWWNELGPPDTSVAIRSGGVAGVISWAQHKHEDSSYLLWMHAGEEPRACASLTAAFVRAARFPRRYAFYFATALTAGLEGLPGGRAATRQAMLSVGMTDLDLWSYMRIPLRHQPAPLSPDVSINASSLPNQWRLVASGDGREHGYVEVGIVGGRTGVIWFLEVIPAVRRRGIGRKLIVAALQHLANNGATEVILYVDDDEPAGERDRAPAKALYNSVGFVEIDRLHSFEMHDSARVRSELRTPLRASL